MINTYEVVLKSDHPNVSDTVHQFDPKKGWTVRRTQHGVEVVYRNESTREYSANLYPWATVSVLRYFGTLDRKLT